MPSFTPYSSALPFMYLSHELFGFDIMLESDCKPFLIEVNISPSLASSSPLDRDIKGWAAASKNSPTPPPLPFCPTCLLFTPLFVPFNLQDGFSGTCLTLLGFTRRRYGPTQCQTTLHRSWASQRRCSRHGGTVVRFWLRKIVLSEEVACASLQKTNWRIASSLFTKPCAGTKNYSQHLLPGEKLKHAFYVQHHDELAAKNNLASILDDLTDDDVCMLMESEEEVGGTES